MKAKNMLIGLVAAAIILVLTGLKVVENLGTTSFEYRGWCYFSPESCRVDLIQKLLRR